MYILLMVISTNHVYVSFCFAFVKLCSYDLVFLLSLPPSFLLFLLLLLLLLFLSLPLKWRERCREDGVNKVHIGLPLGNESASLSISSWEVCSWGRHFTKQVWYSIYFYFASVRVRIMVFLMFFFFNFFVVQYWKHLVMQRQFTTIIVAVLENSFYSVLLRLGILLAAKSPTVSFPF